ncbi:GNAT family N-acetyltransferase [Comamonas testosteroni]|uniref:GNAT family N-acetyltransferase n=1 Tax=Comamonas testosteroni TaxID=285 RepID=UPI00391ACEA4
MQSTVIDQHLAISDPERFVVLSALAKRELESVSGLYPGFTHWYQTKVEPGLISGQRKILVRAVRGCLAGLAVLKIAEERKLCCLRVMPEFQGSGVGVRLFKDAFEELKTEHPLLSVADARLPIFDKVFDYFGFQIGGVYVDMYRANSKEYSFNGTLLLPASQ